MKNEELISKLYELQEEMKILERKAVEMLEANQLNVHEEYMKKHQDVYSDYWNLVNNSVKEIYQAAVEEKIGKDRFIEKVYIDTLAEVMEDDGKILCEYCGYRLRKGYDLSGCMTYWIYQDNYQVGESYDFYTDDVAIRSFKNLVDEQYFEL